MLNYNKPIIINNKLIGYWDHLDSRSLYLLPSKISIAMQGDDKAAFSMFGYAGEYSEGWRLNVKPQLVYDETVLEELEDAQLIHIYHLPVESGWVRLKMVVPAIQENEETKISTKWYPTETTGDEIIGLSLILEPVAAQALEQLLSTENLPVDALEIEVIVNYRGLRPSFPAKFRFSPAAFHKFMTKMLRITANPDNGASDANEPTHILTKSMILTLCKQWLRSQLDDAFTPKNIGRGSTRSVEEELAQRLMAAGWILMPQSNEGPDLINKYTLRSLNKWDELRELDEQQYDGVEITWDLHRPHTQFSQWAGSWKFSHMWKSLSQSKKDELFLRVPVPAPLLPTPIAVINMMPLALHEIKKLIAKLHYFGTGLDWEDREIVFSENGDIAVSNRNIEIQWTILPRDTSFNYFYTLEAYFGIPEQGG